MTGGYIARHVERTGRTRSHAFYTRDRLREWKGYRLAEDQYQDPEEHPVLKKETKSTIVDFIEEFPGILSNFTGMGGCPLDYIKRENAVVPSAADQFMFDTADTPFSSIRDEVSIRSSQNGAYFAADNVLEFLKNATQSSHLDLVKGNHTPWDDAQKVRRFLTSVTTKELEIPIVRAQDVYVTTGMLASINYLRNLIKPFSSNRRVIASTQNVYHDYQWSNGDTSGYDHVSREIARIHREIAELCVDTVAGCEGDGTLGLEVVDRYYRPAEWKRLVAEGLHMHSEKSNSERNGRDLKSVGALSKRNPTRKGDGLKWHPQAG